MNYLNERIGRLYYQDKSYELTRNETKILSELLDNKLKTYEKLYEVLYEVPCTTLNTRKPIIDTISRIRRKTGIKIICKTNFGVRLEDEICLF